MRHKLKIALQMDPLEKLDLKGDSTFMLGLEAIKRGFELYFYSPSDLIYKNNNDLRVLSKIKLSDKIVLDNKVFKNFIDKDLSNVIEELKLLYEDYWKRENQINTSIKLPLTIAINILNEKKIEDFEKTIEKFNLVSSFRVFKLDKINIYYRLIFNGTPQAFILQMKRSGYDLDIKNKIWVLQ